MKTLKAAFYTEMYVNVLGYVYNGNFDVNEVKHNLFKIFKFEKVT